MIKGVSHLTFIVQDIDKSTEFFQYIFGATVVYDSGDKHFSLSKERFIDINGTWVAIMQGTSLAEKTYNHIAFEVEKNDLSDFRIKIEKLGLEILNSRERIEGEGDSLYFYDYDNHLFELHTGTLKSRLTAYKRLEYDV